MYKWLFVSWFLGGRKLSRISIEQSLQYRIRNHVPRNSSSRACAPPSGVVCPGLGGLRERLGPDGMAYVRT